MKEKRKGKIMRVKDKTIVSVKNWKRVEGLGLIVEDFNRDTLKISLFQDNQVLNFIELGKPNLGVDLK